MTRARRPLALLAAGWVVLAGCGETTAPAPAPPPPTETVPEPVDELAEDELAEGAASAFGFPIPAKLRLAARTSTRVAAWGPVPFEEVANYVRARIDAEQTSTGPGKTVFDVVTIKAPRPSHATEKPLPNGGSGDEVIRIDVSTTRRGWTQLVVTRRVRPRVIEGLTEDQRWERLGLTKDGRPADPGRFE